MDKPTVNRTYASAFVSLNLTFLLFLFLHVQKNQLTKPLLESENTCIEGSTTSNEFSQDQNIGGRFFTELVDIMVDEGELDRGYTEMFMTQGIGLLRQVFANMARRCASECFSVTMSSESSEISKAKLGKVMAALKSWERTETSESSQSPMPEYLSLYNSQLIRWR